jgi:hypothetical protein
VRATRPFLISNALLFDAVTLHDDLARRGVRVGTATSVRREQWSAASIYPETRAKVITTSHAARIAPDALSTDPNVS